MNNKELRNGAILSYVYIFVSFGVTICFTPLLIKFLGDSEYGIYNLALSFMSYLEFLNTGMSSTYIKFAAKADSKEKLASINGLMFKIYMIFGIIAASLGLIAILFIDDFFTGLTTIEINHLRILLYMMVFNVILSSANGLFDSNIVLNEKFTFQKIVAIIKKIFLPIVAIPLMLMGMNVIAVGAVYVLANLVSLILNISYCLKHKQIDIKFEHQENAFVKKVIYFYFFVFLTIIVDQINWSIDSFIIGRLRGSFEVSLYSVAHQINSVFLLFATGISSVFITRIHKIDANDNDSYLNLAQRVGRIQFIILSLALTGLIFFGKKFIEVWAGPQYSDSYIIALLLVSPLVFITIKSSLTEVYRAKNKHVARTMIYLGIAIVNAIISYFLCQKYGAIGAALGTTISLAIGNIIIMNFYDHKVVKINMFAFWKEILKLVPGVLIASLFGILIVNIFDFNNIILYLTSGVIYILIYCIIIYFLLNKEEKDFVKSIFNKLKRGKHEKRKVD